MLKLVFINVMMKDVILKHYVYFITLNLSFIKGSSNFIDYVVTLKFIFLSTLTNPYLITH